MSIFSNSSHAFIITVLSPVFHDGIGDIPADIGMLAPGVSIGRNTDIDPRAAR